MVTCPNGHENPEGSAFCSSCGARIDGAPADRASRPSGWDPIPAAPPGSIRPSGSPSGGIEPKQSFGGWVKAHKVLAAVVAVILIVTVGALADGVDTQRADLSPSSDPPRTSLSPTPLTSLSPTAAPSPTPPPAPAKPKSYSGSGDRILSIKKPSGQDSEPVIATFTYTGSSNFAVWTLNGNLKQDDLLVNTIGNYQGTVPMDLEQGKVTRRLQIEAAGGSWKVTLKPLARARSFDASTQGRGDEVLLYRGSRGVANITYRGQDNFIVVFYADSSDLLVNEIGNYEGQVVFGDGPALVEISGGSGGWTIKVK